MSQIKFTTNPKDAQLIHKIAERAVNGGYKLIPAMMDLTACHANGCPLRLRELLTASDIDFAHDVFGIREHLDRTTGKLGDHFTPRYAVKP